METLDVVIVGAGLSGIGAACHLEDRCPGRTYTLLESRDALGGTWDLFRYPGIRSDSDMHTLGYQFKPWKARKSIADGPSIRAYVEEAATEYGIQRQIRYRHQIHRVTLRSPLHVLRPNHTTSDNPNLSRQIISIPNEYSKPTPFPSGKGAGGIGR